MPNLLSVTQVRAYLALTEDDSYDEVLTPLLPVVTHWFEQYCARGLCERTVVDEEYLFNYRNRLYLTNFPITTIVSIKKDNSGEMSILDFHINRAAGYIVGKRDGIGYPRLDNAELIEVSYTGGYAQANVPADLGFAFSLVCGQRAGVPATSASGGGSGGAIKSIGLGGGALEVSFDTSVKAGTDGAYDVTNVPPDVQAQASVLNYYRRIEV